MALEKTHDESALLAAIKLGNEEAFSEIFRRYEKQVFAFSLTLTKSKETAKDVVQDVFSKLWERRDQIEAQQSFQAYVKKITYNQTISFFRKVKLDRDLQRELYLNIQALHIEQRAEAFDQELPGLYEKLVDQLPAQRKKAYLMSRNLGLRYETIAKKMGISKNTVRNHIAEALHFIRQKISQQYNTNN
ncbi:MAG: RNA polymerase sigma-70 factor [Chitinophagaceae bacterium]|nr:RNA polymerase sigma-70 factor [Chitinophagaceae bacterium]